MERYRGGALVRVASCWVGSSTEVMYLFFNVFNDNKAAVRSLGVLSLIFIAEFFYIKSWCIYFSRFTEAQQQS